MALTIDELNIQITADSKNATRALTSLIKKLEKLKEEMYSKRFNVRYGDIDSNNHVNNVNYTKWATEAIPVEILYKCELKELSVVFEKECSYGEEIKSICEVKESENEYIILHKIENSEGKELTTLISKWSKNISK